MLEVAPVHQALEQRLDKVAVGVLRRQQISQRLAAVEPELKERVPREANGVR